MGLRDTNFMKALFYKKKERKKTRNINKKEIQLKF